MVDYSRFNHIGSDSDSDDDTSVGVKVPTPTAATASASPAATAVGGHMAEKALLIASNTNASSVFQQAPRDTIGDGSSESGQSFGVREREGGGGGAGGGGGGGGESASLAQPMVMQASKEGKEGRIKFEHEGRTVYEWEQSLEEVNLYIETPPGLQADHIDCKITPKHIRLGIKGNPPFIDEDTGGPVVVEESYWMMDGGELNVNLQKMKKADTWPAALQGRNAKVDPMTLEGMQKKIMLERFQNENPGFDFSGAEFNGQVPDARTFMGGVKYT